MKTSERILEVKNKIVNYHGRYEHIFIHLSIRIDNIKIYDKDPFAVQTASAVNLGTQSDDSLDKPKVNE